MKQFRMLLPSLRVNAQSTISATGFNAINGGGTSASSTMLGVDQTNIETKKLGAATA